MASALSMQLSAPVDMDLVKQYKSPQMPEAMLIRNIGLQWGMLEFEYGDALPRLSKDVSAVSGAAVTSVAKSYLSIDKRYTVLLKPRG